MKKVEVLLSIYNPNLLYLEKQLKSLESQDYKEIVILVHDDCVTNRCDISIFKENLKETPFRILPYLEDNLGYTKAFERLVENSNADYLAFCDQDDIWMSDKISKCVKKIENEELLLVATDKQIIDENDNIICESSKLNNPIPYNKELSNDEIGKFNFFSTYADGMSLVFLGEFARKCIPFSKHTGHDKWLIACCCACGKISFINETLVQYRRHNNNVSGSLKGIVNKSDYVHKRIEPNYELVQDFKKYFPNYKFIKEIDSFVIARVNHKVVQIYKYRYLAPNIAKFEIIFPFIPNCIFKFLVNIIRNKNR